MQAAEPFKDAAIDSAASLSSKPAPVMRGKAEAGSN
jgi:hypothetical protein